ncbi:glycosyltransferase [Vagococcus fluvialis]|uniref:glycosyltransferase n=1 Tax=Vagococcus fluvialis TaxID=2738 RepID=UPI001D0AC8CA|nr:glycosyltransferase [Vagococcus fluvialis]UDM70615.1 glycosyltransferase [Vagococcus fluvialis]UDM78035.1 glycosyltransferase [Vagococcus fluvialis]UDM82304.1 glycosyltransferase [Vagococcus fluvialis]
MKILWLTNIPVGNKISSTGSWLENLSKELENVDNIDLIYCFPGKEKQSKKGIYTFDDKKNQEKFSKILLEEKVDLVHIHGTEMKHCLEMVMACKENRIPHIISVQGLVSIINKHLIADLPPKVIYGYTLRNLLLRDSIAGLKKQYRKKGEFEKKAIESTKYVIGRTMWDYASVTEIKKEIKYFHCNEVLRDTFYSNQSWDFEKINPNTIFVSQASYSLKGLHYLLWAMPSILSEYPNTKIKVAGKKMGKPTSLSEKLKETFYSKYLQKIIKKYQLTNNIEFLGNLSAEEMRNQYLKAHLFVSLSTMENESNSLSEAKMLGTPSIASYVGGVVDRIKHGEDGFLYQHNSTEMLSFYVKKIFSSDILAKKISSNSVKNAKILFNKNENVSNILEVYQYVLFQENN